MPRAKTATKPAPKRRKAGAKPAAKRGGGVAKADGAMKPPTREPGEEARLVPGNCNATTKTDANHSDSKRGRPCAKTAGWGTTHPGVGRCRLHGGSTPAGVKSAQAQAAELEVANFGLPIDVDPHTALVMELQRSAGHAAFLHAKVQSLPENEMVGPVGGAQGGYPEWKPSVWVNMYNAERKYLAEIAAACIKAGIEERRVRVAEQTGQLLADAIRGILDELGVDLTAKKTATVVRKHLVGLQGGQAVEAS